MHPHFVRRILHGATLGAASIAAIAALGAPAFAQGSAPAPGLCDRPITPWLLLGPFPVDSGAARLTGSRVGDQAALAPTPGAATAGHQWIEARTDSLGRIDFTHVLPGSDFESSAAYAVTYIASPAARDVTLAVESDDDVMVWLDGQLVHSKEAARGVESETDTVHVTLHPGVNRLEYKVVNRAGGFGMGARLLAESKDPVADLAMAVRPEGLHAEGTGSSALLLGPARLGATAELVAEGAGSGRLAVPLTACVSRPGAMGDTVTITGGGATTRVDVTSSEPAMATLDADWSALAAQGAHGSATLTAAARGATPRSVTLPVSASDLLGYLSAPIVVRGWRLSNGGAPGGDMPWTPGDTVDGRAAHALLFDTRVPEALGGLTVEMLASEFGPGATYQLNGNAVRPDSLGRITLCGPCTAGAPLHVRIEPNGALWWDPPRLRVKELGWREIEQGAMWARYFTGDSSIASPDSAVAARMLAAALDPSKRAYLGIVSEWLQRLAPAAAKIRADTIDIVGNSHIDAAWLWRWRETVGVVEATWGTATKLLAKYPQMHFAASAAQYYQWLADRDPALLDRIRKYDREGRWNLVGGWWVEPDENMPSGESLARQGLYGQRTMEKLFGHPAHVAWTPDSFGYTWTLPQILLESGFDAFVTQKLRWNDTDKWPASLNAFWWQSPDGSRILTYIPYGYDHDLDPRTLAEQEKATLDSSASKRMLVLYGVGDHGGGPTMAMLDRSNDTKRIPTFPVLRDASPESSLSRMRADLASNGPVVNGELYLEYHRGVLTTQSEMKRWVRHMETLLGATEAAAAAAPLPYPRDTLREAWERTLFNQFHDILPGSGIADVYKDATVDYRHADSLATAVLDHSLAAIASGLDTRAPRDGARHTAYVVFNPSGVARTDAVLLPDSGIARVHDARGRTLGAVRAPGGLVVTVPDVPATGAVVIFAHHGAHPARRAPGVAARRSGNVLTLDNGLLRVDVDAATGEIRRLVDERTHRTAVGAGGNGLVMLYDKPKDWDAWNIDNLNGARTWIRGTASLDDMGGIVVRARNDSTTVVQRYSMRPGVARLDVSTDIDWHESHELLKAVFPLAFHVDSTHAAIAYGVIARPTVPRTRRDSARFETSMHKWVDASARDYGVALVNHSKYGYSAHGDTLFLSLLRSPKYPDPNADMGKHHFIYSIVPHAGDWRAPAVREAARSLNDSLRVLAVEQHAGRARDGSLVRVDGSGVRLGAVKRAEDGDALIVRLVEGDGRATTARVHVAGAVSARETNILETPTGKSFPVRDGTIEVPLAPWKIETIAITQRR